MQLSDLSVFIELNHFTVCMQLSDLSVFIGVYNQDLDARLQEIIAHAAK